MTDDAQRLIAESKAEERASRPYLSPPVCAAMLGVSAAFIRGEVKEGRLSARVMRRDSGRSVYRIPAEAFTIYVERYWPEKVFHAEHKRI
jgi:hypothetical protein